LPRPAHIVVFRFSALGDVAMTVPVIKLLLQQYPDLHVTYVSTGFVQPLFEGIDRLLFLSADLKEKHSGVTGLFRLFKIIRKNRSIDAVADLHNVLRTKIIRGFFSFSGLKTAVIDKGRKEKAELTRIENKDFHPLKSTFERYADVFARLGYPVVLNATVKPAASRQPPAAKAYGDGTQPVAGGQSLWRRNAASNKGNFKYKIGIAPFCKTPAEAISHRKDRSSCEDAQCG
jgi:ADP-heptose:LPS heptosyltransferase